uniref:Membrane insertase YidC/Oxa/ALB C-terminal domain-containing protein n=1 Tax=Attheya septentrionalis TaxID=420275 RepID=A0A7S2XMM7_9STRA|mmetsp:Transcript_14118/g.25558  ORF Transcript_14118/g.25558 Transcript_14118/m.25558 type:complete len:456 (+) Transcript_14118:169-1536(+)|eukprot:CAMPEP_0198289642 /NCGR_PEP_ID=MMETSP1449-20131203/7757_1 /TAXON_ID=420275 /ORGANISM="Attheya septentrionalis, Strain CCMP2084" /LENGTH=455 /DNA_ID=CAMNT_0043987999 /DNA_START=186 /DNA_END=1553 /DNA_ORIENTATION=+
MGWNIRSTLWCVAAASLVPSAAAFATRGSGGPVTASSFVQKNGVLGRISSSSSSVMPLHVMPPMGPEMEFLQHSADFLQQHSMLLADVASDAVSIDGATVDAAVVADAGWWQNYLQVFKSVLVFVHSTVDQPLRNMGITQTWGISIAIFTAGARAILIPLSIQQSKQAEYMKAIKPYQNEIKKKFAGKEELINRANAKLFEDAGTNPLAGCFVSLAQLPVLLGLYRSITLLAKDGELNEPFLWIPTLEGPVSAPDYRGMEWLTQGWTTDIGSSLPVPPMGWETTLAFLIMPVILVLGQSLTMRTLQPPVDDTLGEDEKAELEKSQGFLKFLPLMIGYFSLQVPAGLTIYWFTSNAFTLLQSLSVKAYFAANPPNIELPDYWDSVGNDSENMTPEERRKAAEAGIATGPKFEDLLDEARYHYVVERVPLREGSPAWERAQAEGVKIPEPMSSWVGV